MMGRMMREYFLPLLGQFGFLQYLKHDQSVPDDVTPEYCAKHNWLIGSPRASRTKWRKSTMSKRLRWHSGVRFRSLDNPNAWHIVALDGEQVAPRIKHLTPA